MTDYRSSPKWPLLRQLCFEKWGLRCLRCGKTPKDGVLIEGDHVKAVMKYPELSLELSNLQPLCGPCNKWKGTRTIDFRPTLMGKIKKALSVIAIVALVGFILTHQVIRDPLLELAKPYIAESLGLLTADLCEATVVP